MKAKIINGNIIWFSSDIKYEVTSTFFRMAEFYESPFKNIRDTYFSMDMYMDTYAKANDYKFTYFDDWDGFNFPGESLLKFKETFMGDMRGKEADIIYTIGKNIDTSKKFYVIATTGDGALKHEYAHALYYVNPEYKLACDNIYSTMSTNALTKIHKYLTEKGYTEFTFKDETQAYLGTNTNVEMLQEFSIGDIITYIPAITQFRKIFQNSPKMDTTAIV